MYVWSGNSDHAKSKIDMSLDDIKIFTLNSTTLAISISSTETLLKIVLLVISICYTGHKWYVNILNRKRNK